MKLWIDKTVEAPEGYTWCRDVIDAVVAIRDADKRAPFQNPIELIDMYYDANDNEIYNEVNSWLMCNGYSFPTFTHSHAVAYTDFCDDEEKMYDFVRMSKRDFLASYSYLTELEYDLTKEKYRKESKDV